MPDALLSLSLTRAVCEPKKLSAAWPRQTCAKQYRFSLCCRRIGICACRLILTLLNSLHAIADVQLGQPDCTARPQHHAAGRHPRRAPWRGCHVDTEPAIGWTIGARAY